MLLAVVAALVIQFPIGRLGDLGRRDGKLATAHSAQAFDSVTWRAGDPAARGRMLADLARRYRFERGQAETVDRLLGPGNCKAAFDDEPCYSLELGGEPYDLQFLLKHSGNVGEVTDMRLVPR